MKRRLGAVLALAAVVVGFVLLGPRDCGCAPPGEVRTPIPSDAALLPSDFVLTAPWEAGERRRIIRGYNVAAHQGFARPNRSNDAYALDFNLERGDPVLAAAPGVVTYAGPASGGWESFGNIVLLEHAGGVSSLYAHLDAVAVRERESLERGAQLGTAGNSGGVRTHLHLSLYRDVQLARGERGTGPFGGASVLPEPFGREARVGLSFGQCLTADDGG